MLRLWPSQGRPRYFVLLSFLLCSMLHCSRRAGGVHLHASGSSLHVRTVGMYRSFIFNLITSCFVLFIFVFMCMPRRCQQARQQNWFRAKYRKKENKIRKAPLLCPRPTLALPGIRMSTGVADGLSLGTRSDWSCIVPCVRPRENRLTHQFIVS